MKSIFKFLIPAFPLLTAITQPSAAQILPPGEKTYKLWYNAPAPNEGGIFNPEETDRPIDLGWENLSLPIGNGYMGGGRIRQNRQQEVTDNRQNAVYKRNLGI